MNRGEGNSSIINQGIYYGGKSTDPKIGITNSFGDSIAMDFRKNPSQLTVLPSAYDYGDNTVTDLLMDMTQTPDGVRWAVGEEGKFYQISSDNTFTYEGDTKERSGGGIMYRQDTDFMYLTGQTTVSRYGMVQKRHLVDKGLQEQYFAETISTDPLVAQTLSTDATGAFIGSGVLRSTASEEYTVATAISESETSKCIFLPDIEPFYSIKLRVTTKGSGDLTLYMHDNGNNKLAEVTVANADIEEGDYVEFKFDEQVRATVKPNTTQYHFHVVSTAAGTKVASVVADDLMGADFQLYAYRMVAPSNKLHPIAQFQQYVCIGNERYLTVWEPLSDNPDNLEWQRHRLTFPPGYEVTSLAVNDEYLLIACEKRSEGDARGFQEGIIFFWDGSAQTYNFFIEVMMGAPYSMYTYQNITYMYIAGAVYAWTGGKQLVKVRTFEGTDSEYSSIEDETTVYPNMITTRRGIMLLGYPSQTTLPNIRFGVHSWGSIDKNFPMSFGYSYYIPGGKMYSTQDSPMRIGMIKNFVDTLYISYEQDGKPGVGIVNNDSYVSPNFSYQSLTYDGDMPYKEKLLLRTQVTMRPLPEGVTLTPKYKLDGEDWVYGPVATAGDTVARIDVASQRFRELTIGFDGTADNTRETPAIISVAAEVKNLQEERDL